MPGRVGCASVVRIECRGSGAPKGAERFQTGHEALGRGRMPQGLELDAYLQVTTAERFTPYLSAIRLRPLSVGQFVEQAQVEFRDGFQAALPVQLGILYAAFARIWA